MTDLIELEPSIQYIHHFDKDTKEFLYKEEVKDYDKEASIRLGRPVPLIPANATLLLVPEYGENEIPVYSSHYEQQITVEQIPVYDEETGEITSYTEQEKTINVLVEKWTIKPDYRKNYYKVDDKLQVEDITTIGEQEGFYLVEKEIGEDIKLHPDKYKISGGSVTEKTEEEYQSEQLQQAKAAKLAENATALEKKDSLTTSLGVVKIQTPIGKIDVVVTSMLNLVQITQQPLSGGFLRVYVDGVETPSPEMSIQQVGAFYLEIVQKIKAMDTLYKKYEVAINQASGLKELEAINLDYSSI